MTKSKRWKSQLFTNLKTIALGDITADQSMQQRAKFHDEIISEYAEILSHDGELAPIKVVRDEDGTLWLWDGFHTLEAAKQAGKATIKAEISRGTRRDAWEKSLSANETHGIRRSRADRQKAVDNALSDREIKISLLEEDAKYSFRSIAKLCNVGHQTVSRRWNDVHLPKIMEEIDSAINQESLPALMTNQEWFAQIGRDLNVPAWLVEQRYVQSQEALTLAEEEISDDEPPGTTTDQTLAQREDVSEEKLTGGPSPAHQTESAQIEGVNDSHLTGGPSPTHQTGSAPIDSVNDGHLTGGPSPTHQTGSTPNKGVSDGHLTGGPSPTHQTGSAPIEGVSDDHLTGGPSPTHQTGSAPIESVNDGHLTGSPSPTHQTGNAQIEGVSDGHLTGGPSPTHQTGSAQIEGVSDGHLTGGPSPTHQKGSAPSALGARPVPANIIIHNPTVTPRYSGQDAGEILTSYMSEEVGVKVVEARRPDEGWTQVGQEITQALSVAVGDDIKDISSMLIVIVR